MSSIEHLDMLLGDALERIVEAADEIREIDYLDQKECLKVIGRSVTELWKIREHIYKINPELKRDFIIEHKQDKARFENLNEIYKKAAKSEKKGEYNSAKGYYTNLYEESRYGYFKLIAEAGLYRLSKEQLENNLGTSLSN